MHGLSTLSPLNKYTDPIWVPEPKTNFTVQAKMSQFTDWQKIIGMSQLQYI